MFLGTGSDVGKSIAAVAFCRILKRRGFKVAPFKAQNMSNNSYVTVEGGEIGRAQVSQAEAAGLLPSVHMNPVLLKPSSGQSSQVVLQGKVASCMSAMEYHKIKPKLMEMVMDSYDRLAAEYEVIVLEGAGSCCEMNLKENDLVNFKMARAADARCILVADIDRGGVFAQLVGSIELMTPEEQELTAGFIINKFRGDSRLFDSGIDYIEKKTGKPVLGLVPFFEDIYIDPEDSVGVQIDKKPLRPLEKDKINIAVTRLPTISNFTDFEILERESDVVVNYLSLPDELLNGYDWLILPGTKNVMEDSRWMKLSGWTNSIQAFARRGGRILGICGGYQLLGKTIKDPIGIESSKKKVAGIGLLPMETVLASEKVVRKVIGRCFLNRRKVIGYEIHMGHSQLNGKGVIPFLRIHEPGSKKTWHDGWSTENARIMGTYVHGLLDSPGLRSWFLNEIRISKGLRIRKPGYGRRARFHQYDRLADHFEAHCDVEGIIGRL
jgi:adenosylcobyric acid synthase